MSNKASLKIIIKGEKGSGKSTLLNVVGHALKGLGLNVECVDEFGSVSPYNPCEEGVKALDGRKILVKTNLS